MIRFAIYKAWTCSSYVLGKRTPLKKLKKFTKKSPNISKPTRKRKATEEVEIDLENEFEEAEPPIDIETGNLQLHGVTCKGLKEFNIGQILIRFFVL